MKLSYVLLLSVSAAMQAIATTNVEPSTSSVPTVTDIEDHYAEGQYLQNFKRAIESSAVNAFNSFLGRDLEIQARKAKGAKKGKAKPSGNTKSKGKGDKAAKGKGKGDKAAKGKGKEDKANKGKEDKAAVGKKPRGCKGIIKKKAGKSTGGKAGGKKGKGGKRAYTDFLMLRGAQATPTAFQTVGARS